MPDRPHNTERALIVCSLWLHVGFIGAAASAVGLLQLFDGTWLPGLALIVSGGVLAATSWRRARTVLHRAEGASAVTTVASPSSWRTSAPDARSSSKKQKLQSV